MMWVLPTVVFVVLLSAVAVYSFIPTATRPSEVTLTGTVATSGAGTVAERIIFISMSDQKTYVSDITDGHYTIAIRNGDSYRVTITWKFLGMDRGGASDAGTLDLDTTSPNIVRNWHG